MSLGQRLKKEREKRGWSQIYVSKQMGITNTVLSNYERDYRDPDTDTLKRLAELYEVSVDYLLGRTAPSSLQQEEFDDPELGLWFKELQEAPEERREELKRFWEFLKQQEASRTPGKKQGE